MGHRPNLFHVIGDWWDHRQAKRRAATFLPPSPRLSRWLPTRGNVLFTLLMIALLLWAQTAGALPLGRFALAPSAPSTSTIAYQGRLADADGNPLTATVSMVFRLYGQEAGGAPLWTEPWTGSNGVKVRDGLFNVMLGSLEPLPQAVVTGHNQLFLGITVDTDDEMVPRVQLGTVPFAVQALTVPDGSVTTAKIADGAVTQAKLGEDVSLEPPDGSITTAKIADGSVTSNKLAEELFIYQMTNQVTNIAVSGSRPNYSFQIDRVEFSEPFLHKTLSLVAWLNIPGTHYGVPIAQPWSWDNAGFAINSKFYCDCDISTIKLSYTAVGY